MDLRDNIKVDIKPQEKDEKKENKEEKKEIKEHDGIVGDPGPISSDDLIGMYDR